MDNKKSDIINKRKYHHPKAVVKGKDGKVRAEKAQEFSFSTKPCVP